MQSFGQFSSQNTCLVACDLSRKSLPDLRDFWYEYSGLICCFFSRKLTFMKDKSLTKNFAALTIILSGAKDADQYV